MIVSIIHYIELIRKDYVTKYYKNNSILYHHENKYAFLDFNRLIFIRYYHYTEINKHNTLLF